MPEQRHRPFSNGSQYIDWQNSNCCRCKKVDWSDPADARTECPILIALSRASLDDGTVSEDIARRMGYLEAYAPGRLGPYVWPCGEVEWTEEWKAEWRAMQQAKEPMPLFPDG